jgi:uroporphyrinogen-III synthase
VGEKGEFGLRGRRVLITRAKEQSESLSRELAARGAIAVCIPLLEFSAVEDSAALDAALRKFSEFDWLFLTSQNALHFVLERAEKLGISLAKSGAWVKVAAVARATATAAEREQLRVSYVGKMQRGIGLAEELGEELRGKKIFLPRSDKASAELPEALRRAGAQVEEVVAYRTHSTTAASAGLLPMWERGELDAIVLFSPSAVAHLADIAGERLDSLQTEAALVAIGPVTRAALRERGVERVLMAPEASELSVVEAMERFFAAQGPQTAARVKRG